jgi:hypothetical protein
MALLLVEVLADWKRDFDPPLSDFLFRVILIKKQSTNEFISFEIHFCLHRTRGPFY